MAEPSLPEHAVSPEVIVERAATDQRPIRAGFMFAGGRAAALADVLRKIGFDLDALDAAGLAGPRGRVDAGPGFALCIGSTHTPRHRQILLDLAGLPFVERISRCDLE